MHPQLFIFDSDEKREILVHEEQSWVKYKHSNLKHWIHIPKFDEFTYYGQALGDLKRTHLRSRILAGRA